MRDERLTRSETETDAREIIFFVKKSAAFLETRGGIRNRAEKRVKPPGTAAALPPRGKRRPGAAGKLKKASPHHGRACLRVRCTARESDSRGRVWAVFAPLACGAPLEGQCGGIAWGAGVARGWWIGTGVCDVAPQRRA